MLGDDYKNPWLDRNWVMGYEARVARQEAAEEREARFLPPTDAEVAQILELRKLNESTGAHVSPDSTVE